MANSKMIFVACFVALAANTRFISSQENGKAPPKAKASTKKKSADTPASENGRAGDKANAAKGDASTDSIQRPEKPPRIPDPREFEVHPDKDGLIRFNFHGQSWPDILQWLANNANYSLDWQEMPKDYVNLTTQRSYTIQQAMDLFNRLLMDRGYTMVKHDRILSVVRIDKMDPSLLPRAEDESQLLDLPPHDFVKITFKLPDELKASQAAEDVKPLLSPHGKVQPLLATNRLLIIDAVANLREIGRLVNSEHAAAVGHSVPNEFIVHYARADRVADQVMILLGLDPSSRRTPQELQVEQQRLQLFQQMHQKNKDITKYLRPNDSPRVYLAVNDRNNSILANAPPAEMKIVERAIERLDVPSDFATAAAAGLLSMSKYKLVTLSPQSIVTALEEIGNLDPRTCLRTDSEAKTVFANATARDHETIQAMIDHLDGTGRQLEVIWLRRLPAKAVAQTIQNLMVGKEEEKESGSRWSYYYYRDSSSKKENANAGFRVDADLEKNRLLLWANEVELTEVRRFLEKLGEIPGRSGNPHTVRFLDPANNESTLQILKQLRQIWNEPNELRIDVPETVREPESDSGHKTTFRLRDSRHRLTAAAHGPTDTPSRAVRSNASQFELASAKQPSASTGASGVRPSNVPPIIISVTPDGRIMLNSQDPKALDQLEDLLASLTPPAPNYKVFYLKYASASMVTINLEEYFEEEVDINTDDNWWRAYYGFEFETNSKSDDGLSQQRKIRFIFDYDTNSILVANASLSQLSTVDALIKIYDMPPSEDSISARSFEVFQLKFSRATAVAKTIKEVYRDLLSSKDKDFDNKAKGEKQEGSQTNNYYRIAGANESDNAKTTKVRASFEGALSVGVDEISNTVIVSAQEEWMPGISKLIEFLDVNARPKTKLSVVEVSGKINASSLEAALAEMLGDAWIGNLPPGSKEQTLADPRSRDQQQPVQAENGVQPSNVQTQIQYD